MAADEPTILATSGGFMESQRLHWEVGPLTRHAVELAGVTGRAPASASSRRRPATTRG